MNVGIGQRTARAYINESTLETLADRLVEPFEAEEPGSDLSTLDRTAKISVAGFGRLITRLAEAIQFFETDPPIDGDDRRSHVYDTTQLLMMIGVIQSDYDGGNTNTIPTPPALLTRIARTLTTVAERTEDTGLAKALRHDAMRARTAAATPES